MPATLGRCHDIGLVFDRTGAQQQLPMGLTGGVGEGRRHAKQVTSHSPRLKAHGAIELREAQVVANAQPHVQFARLHGHRLAASLQHAALVIGLAAVVVAEQMNLVVTRGAPAIGRVDTTGVANPGGVGRAQRQGATDQPQTQLGRSLAERPLDRCLHIAITLGQGQLIAVLPAHQAKVLGQGRQLRTLCRRLGQPVAGPGQVGAHIGARHHLNRSNLHGFTFVLRMFGGRLLSARSSLHVRPREALQSGPPPGSWFRGRPCRADCLALLAPRGWRITLFTHCVRFVQTDAPSQSLKRAGTRAPSRCAAQPFTNRPAAARTAGRLHRDRCAPRRWSTPHSKVARPDDGRFVRGRERSGAAQARVPARFKH